MRNRSAHFLLALVLVAGAVAALVVVVGCRGPRNIGRYNDVPFGTSDKEASRHSRPAATGAGDAMYLKDYGTSRTVKTRDDRLSTFAMDVDTGSYTLCRSYLNRGQLPPPAAVRVEEFVNRFDYGYGPPSGSDALAIHLAAAPSRFGRGKVLLRVGLKAREIDSDDRKPMALTFVIDTSGSMQREDRLELVKKSLRLLVKELQRDDTVGIVEYGTTARRVLRPTSARKRKTILEAIDELEPEGSTNAEEGLQLGYRMASEAATEGTASRIVLCSDGVANVGRTRAESILATVRRHVRRGVTLSAIGFGMGNYNDVLMEQLADQGNGHYVYVDTLDEARRVFVEQLSGTLEVVAREAKIQVRFDNESVRSHRLLGYENRKIANEDFRDDRVDGGEVGAGHSVTALYELTLYPEPGGRLATISVRHGLADGDGSREVSRSIRADDICRKWDDASKSFRLAACVAEFAEILRKSRYARHSSLEDVLEETKRTYFIGDADRRDLVAMMRTARRLRRDEDVAYDDEGYEDE